MQACEQLRFPGSISAIALDASGSHAAVAVGMSPRYLYRPLGEPPLPRLHLFQVADGKLTARQILPVFPDCAGWARLEEARLAFLDERTLLVAVKIVRSVTDQDVVLLALDLPTGQERGRWTGPGFFEHINCDLVPIPPRHALLGLLNTVVCVDVEEFQVTCSAREVEDGDVVEEDTEPEERLTPNGLAYDTTGRAHLLCRAYGEAILLRCRLDLAAGLFHREARRTFPEWRDPVGLCLTPGGGLTLLCQIADALVDRAGRPITDIQSVRAEVLAGPPHETTAPPQTARLGALGLFPDDPSAEPRWVSFDSDFRRDFSTESYHVTGDAGIAIQIGYRCTAGNVNLIVAHGDFLTKPAYVDDSHVVLGTPSGFLLQIDTTTGQSEVVHDFHARINSLQFHPAKRLLLAGCEDGSLTLLTL